MIFGHILNSIRFNASTALCINGGCENCLTFSSFKPFTAINIVILYCEFYKKMGYGKFRVGRREQGGEQDIPVPLAIKHQITLRTRQQAP